MNVLRFEPKNRPKKLFSFADFEYQCGMFSAVWDEDYRGYIIYFSDGAKAYAQSRLILDQNNPNYNKLEIVACHEQNQSITKEQHRFVREFVKQINRINFYFN